MFGHGNYKLPQKEEQSNDEQLPTDIKIEVKSEYTEVCSSSDAEQIIEYEIITVGDLENKPFTNSENILPDDAYNDNQDSISRSKMSIVELSPSSYKNQILLNSELKNKKLTNLENNLPNDVYNDNQESISKCKMFIEELSLSPTSFKNQILLNSELKNKKLTNLENNLPNNTYNDDQDSISRCKMSIIELSPSSNTNHVFKKENEDSDFDHLIECVTDDSYEENKQCSKADLSLDDAFRECLIEINSDLSINVLNKPIENDSSTKTNHKRKILHSDDFAADKNTNNDSDRHNPGVHNEQSYKKKNIVDEKIDISGHPSKSCLEIDFSINNIFYKPSEIEYFKRTSAKFLQRCICLNLPSHIDKCIECNANKNNLIPQGYDKNQCRFYAFRQLKFTLFSKKLIAAGYPDPHKKYLENIDLGVWFSTKNSADPTEISIQASKKILEDTGSQFCTVVKDEIDALKLNLPHKGMLRKIVWKKIVKGVREMCDVCKTTIFNHHWSCGKCGFVVCIDCFKTKLNGTEPSKKPHIAQRNINKKIWLLCSDQSEHEIKNLAITQILVGNSLRFISNIMHNTCLNHDIQLDCSCNDKSRKRLPHKSTNSVYNLFLNNDHRRSNSDDTDDKEEPSPLKAILNKEYLEYCELTQDEPKREPKRELKTTKPQLKFKNQTNYAVARPRRIERILPQLSLWSDDKTNAPHMWLCEGHLLRLLDPKSDINYPIFQEQWKRGQPVLVSDVGNKLSSSLWHPESFSRDFGNQINDLINCSSGDVISDQPMSTFWNGFENSEERLYDKYGDVMLLKLKDWPPSADFAETLPDRFQDLMNCLPLKEYTHRNGLYNLASRLPETIVRPDLGPKMYTAYGNAGTSHKQVGTTNLHLDISDAVNVMVYVAITKNCKKYGYDWYVREALQVIEEAGCDDLTMRRIYEHREIPGALWHIYHASDADSIRDLLIKVSVEHGTPLELCSDPIHDQTHYLDEYLRERLFREYGVKGYTIVQYFGDAVFIPAGAPHQVRNLHNCIKVAEDFVSPENVHHSFRMTQEFRDLTDSHTNHEDKLQIKHIVYHAVKDSISVLMNTSREIE